jgi:hypothetical protein
VAGGRGASSLRWVRAALSRDQIGVVALSTVVFFVLPWRAIEWRPQGLPPGGIEMTFVFVKLTLIALLAHLGWMLMLAAAARAAHRTWFQSSSSQEWIA